MILSIGTVIVLPGTKGGQTLGKWHANLARRPIPNTTGFNTTPWPDFHRFTRLVCLYNIRNHSFEEDFLDAFAGVLSVFDYSFVGGFISGLPQMFFDAALLWQPYRALARCEQLNSNQAILPS